MPVLHLIQVAIMSSKYVLSTHERRPHEALWGTAQLEGRTAFHKGPWNVAGFPKPLHSLKWTFSLPKQLEGCLVLAEP